MKPCATCGETKPLEDFYKRGRESGAHFRDCKACVLVARRRKYEQDGNTLKARVKAYREANRDLLVEKQREWRAANPEAAQQRSRAGQLKKYGMTPEDFDAMLEAQGGRCAICRSGYSGRSWTVDHDHTLGLTAVRGILCWHCNVGLGHFRDDVASLLTAVDYVLGTRETSKEAS